MSGEPERNHLHHVSVDVGMRSGDALAAILARTATVGMFGVLLTYLVTPVASLISFCGSMIAYGYGLLHSAIGKNWLSSSAW